MFLFYIDFGKSDKNSVESAPVVFGLPAGNETCLPVFKTMPYARIHSDGHDDDQHMMALIRVDDHLHHCHMQSQDEEW